ncbi:MAG: hypothetical protein Ta2E_06280 [Mycoplasmoidaceae bacterium]|nr:MAG: hypothetical protein Ta2E_06280 [Mycoplasmoidaceae bacterium]
MQITSQNKNKVNNGTKKRSKFDLILEEIHNLNVRIDKLETKLNTVVELNNLKTR